MKYKRLGIITVIMGGFLLLAEFTFILISKFYNPIKITTDEGIITKSMNNAITIPYTAKSSNGFYATIDFELKGGRVDWEIINPENAAVFEGYVIYENGKVFRELTYPSNYMNGYLNKKEEVKKETDTNGKITIIPDFNYLQFDWGSSPGEYKLNLSFENAEGSYKIEWSNKLPRK